MCKKKETVSMYNDSVDLFAIYKFVRLSVGIPKQRCRVRPFFLPPPPSCPVSRITEFLSRRRLRLNYEK